MAYYHAAAGGGFPTQPTWLAAIKNDHYKTWPGLTASAAAKHFPESVETWRGHGRKIPMNLRSTKKAVEIEEQEYHNAMKEIRESTRESTPVNQVHTLSPANLIPSDPDEIVGNVSEKGCIFAVTYDLHSEIDRKMYTDQTGKFPVCSHRGIKYIKILCEIGGNTIMVDPMKSITEVEMMHTYQMVIGRLNTKISSPRNTF